MLNSSALCALRYTSSANASHSKVSMLKLNQYQLVMHINCIECSAAMVLSNKTERQPATRRTNPRTKSLSLAMSVNSDRRHTQKQTISRGSDEWLRWNSNCIDSRITASESHHGGRSRSSSSSGGLLTSCGRVNVNDASGVMRKRALVHGDARTIKSI